MSIGKVLIVDDEKNIRFTLSKCLKYIDLDSDEAINGEEALQKFDSNKYDLVILDLKMQGMSGIDVLKKIDEIDHTTPVVIITAHGTVDAAVDAMKLGAVDFLQKPFTPKEIQKMVKDIMGRKELGKESIENYGHHIQYARQLISRREFDEAMDILKKAIGLEPLKAEPHNMMGVLLEIQGELEEAKKHYKAALAMEPGYMQAQTNLIRINKRIKEKKT
ncbi:MAG: response regulator [Candidatus Eremiobacteraeota bacterium]|nr:response regulator [Candidatus Eremiobacteraeota bacterium]